MKDLSKMSPFELGESSRAEAVRYLILFLSKGTANEKRLAASAVNKLSAQFNKACRRAVPFLLENLSDSHPQVRQYTLKALAKLPLSETDYKLISEISEKDSTEYNRRAAREILTNKVSFMDEEESVQNDERAFDMAGSEIRFEDRFEKIAYSDTEERFISLLNRECGIELTDKQKAAVLHREGPAMVLAVPGAGKTTVLLSRTANLIINHGINPANILSITFSKASAADMKMRYYRIFSNITSIGANFSTIHSFSYELIRKYSQLKNLNYTVIEDTDSGINKRVMLKKSYLKHNGEHIDEDALDELINSIGYVKNMMFSDGELEEYSTEQNINNFLKIYKEYEAVKKENNFIDYDDMLTLCYDILSRDTDILTRYRNLYKYIQIDEGQDTSKIQHRIIQLIAHPKNNLFIVADDDQSIYSFRGAYPKFLIEFDKLYPDTRKFYIEENFRCTREIADLANKFIKTNTVRFNKELFTRNEQGGPVRVVKVRDEGEQMDFLVGELNSSAQGKDNAVLYRNNMSAIVLGDELSRRGIPFYIKDYNKFFFKHVVTGDVKAFMELILDNSSLDCLQRIYYRISSFISKETMTIIKEKHRPGQSVFSFAATEKLLSEGQRVNLMRLWKAVAALRNSSPKQVISTFENELGYNRFIKENARMLGYSYESLRVVLTNLKSLSARCRSMAAFMVRLEEIEAIMEKSKFRRDGILITLSTIHSSKGLEYSNVYMVDLVDNIIPTRGSIEKYEMGRVDELEEERRLMYVAMTRARKNLTLILIQNKNDDAVVTSRFVNELIKL